MLVEKSNTCTLTLFLGFLVLFMECEVLKIEYFLSFVGLNSAFLMAENPY